MFDYGNFSIWHREADLYLLNLKTGKYRAMTEVNSNNTESFHDWSTNSRWFVFSSRRDDGLYTRLYIAHIDANGKASKPFMKLPHDDPADYGYGPNNGRPVYFCTGKPQQRGKFMNATTGVASTAGKFASDFALGSQILKSFYPKFAEIIGHKATDAYQQGVEQPGNCQTVSVVSPYIYEEDNWVDDMELGAMELYHKTGDKKYLDQALEYGRREPMTP